MGSIITDIVKSGIDLTITYDHEAKQYSYIAQTEPKFIIKKVGLYLTAINNMGQIFILKSSNDFLKLIHISETI